MNKKYYFLTYDIDSLQNIYYDIIKRHKRILVFLYCHIQKINKIGSVNEWPVCAADSVAQTKNLKEYSMGELGEWLDIDALAGQYDVEANILLEKFLATGNPCASGVYPYVGCVAVHRVSSTDSTPIFPFGTAIHYQGSSVNISGINYSNFTVTDTGDPSFTRTTYWTDVYGGERTEANLKMAINYGVKKVTFTWD